MAGRRLVRFLGGGLVGAGIGSAAALLLAPDSGDGLRRSIRERVRQAKLAGAEAQAAKTVELVRKFRQTVDDPDALTSAESEARHRVANIAAAAESAPATSGTTLPG